MGLIILIYGVFFIILLLVTLSDWFDVKAIKTRREFFISLVISRAVDLFFAATILTILLCGIITLVSYLNYLVLRADYDGVVAQYQQAVELYKDKVVINVDQTLTDLRYIGNAEEVGLLVRELRQKVTEYNRNYVIKKKWKENWFVGKFISGPDPDMKIINIR